MTVPLCPHGHSDAAVTYTQGPGGSRIYRCGFRHGTLGEPAYWTVYPPRKPRPPTEELVTDDLLGPFEQIVYSYRGLFIEHGVAEYDLRLNYPHLFGRHVAASGHTILGSGQNTASGTRFGMAMKRLRDSGHLVSERWPATGVWAEHNSDVSYWAAAPAPDTSQRLTWTQRCAQLGRPDSWEAFDVAEVTELVTRWADKP